MSVGFVVYINYFLYLHVCVYLEWTQQWIVIHLSLQFSVIPWSFMRYPLFEGQQYYFIDYSFLIEWKINVSLNVCIRSHRIESYRIESNKIPQNRNRIEITLNRIVSNRSVCKMYRLWIESEAMYRIRIVSPCKGWIHTPNKYI